MHVVTRRQERPAIKISFDCQQKLPMVILHQKYQNQKREEKLEFPPCFPCWPRFKLERDFSLSEATGNYRTQKIFLPCQFISTLGMFLKFHIWQFRMKHIRSPAFNRDRMFCTSPPNQKSNIFTAIYSMLHLE